MRLQAARTPVLVIGALLALIALSQWSTVSPEAGPASTGRSVLAAEAESVDPLANLLVNPGFEESFTYWDNASELYVADGWGPWWRQGTPDQTANGFFKRPEYTVELAEDIRNGHVYRFGTWFFHGEKAQRYFSTFGTHEAGIFQRVSVTPGDWLEFSAWVRVHSSDCDDPCVSPLEPCNSKGNSHGTYRVAVGIDPYGRIPAGLGQVPPDTTGQPVVWSPLEMPLRYDMWVQLKVTAQAQSDHVTVYSQGWPDWPVKNNTIYWDDAALRVLPGAPGATETPGPTWTASPTGTATVTRTPTNTRTQTLTPTATGSPTLTPTATRTPVRVPVAYLPAVARAWLPPTATPTDTPSPTTTATPTPTATGTATPTATLTPGLSVRGHVRLNDAAGPGLAGVAIHLFYAGYAPGPVVATTDAEGYYETPFSYIPGDEMITVWPELAGYAFDPPQYFWRHYYGAENATRDFVAHAGTATPTSTPTPSPSATETGTPEIPSPTPTATATMPLCENLVVNPGFEVDEGWTFAATNRPAGYTTARAYSGTRSLRLGVEVPEEDVEGWSIATQNVLVPAGATNLTVQFHYYGETQDDSGDWQMVLLRTGTGIPVKLLLWLAGPNAGTGGWQTRTVTLAPDLVARLAGSEIQVYMEVYNDGDGRPSALYVDDAILGHCSPDGRVSALSAAPEAPNVSLAVRYPIRFYPGQENFRLPVTCSELEFESLQLENLDSSPVDLSGWTLTEVRDGHIFTFPGGVQLEPGARLRIWVASGPAGPTDLHWGRSEPTWDNRGDEAIVRDAAGAEVARRGYP